MDFEPADLVTFHGRGWKSRVIEIGTRGPSHIGMAAPVFERGMMLAESTTLCDLPDEISGERREGVQFHHLQKRIDAYQGDVYRLRLANGWKLDRHEIEWLQGWLWHRRQQVYDLRRAILSGTRIMKWFALMPYPDPGAVFCSEMCAAALMRLHRLPLQNPAVYNPASLVRELRRCGVYTAPELLKRAA